MKKFLAGIVVVAVLVATAIFLIKYGMTLSMIWWESR